MPHCYGRQRSPPHGTAAHPSLTMLRRAQVIRTERGTLHGITHQSEPLCSATSLSAVWASMPFAGGALGATVPARTSATRP